MLTLINLYFNKVKTLTLFIVTTQNILLFYNCNAMICHIGCQAPNCDSDPSCFVSAMIRGSHSLCLGRLRLEDPEDREDLTELQGSHGLLKIHFLSTESSQYPEKPNK